MMLKKLLLFRSRIDPISISLRNHTSIISHKVNNCSPIRTNTKKYDGFHLGIKIPRIPHYLLYIGLLLLLFLGGVVKDHIFFFDVFVLLLEGLHLPVFRHQLIFQL